jgi:hypothetical protein
MKQMFRAKAQRKKKERRGVPVLPVSPILFSLRPLRSLRLCAKRFFVASRQRDPRLIAGVQKQCA